MKFPVGLFFIVCALAMNVVFANEKCSCNQVFKGERIAVEAENLLIQEGTIYVQLDNRYYLTSAVFADEQGLFIKDYASYGCSDDEWRCPNCRRCNKLFYLLCPKCSKANWLRE